MKLCRLFIIFILTLNVSYLKLQGDIPSIYLTERQLCDLELIFNGGFAPLDGFMDSADYNGVVNEMRLQDGSLWPIPIVLDVKENVKQQLEDQVAVALRDPEGTILAYMHLRDIWCPDKIQEAQKVYGTTSSEHPGVNYLFNQMGDYYVGGKVCQIANVKHYDFLELRKTPEELKALFKAQNCEKVVAFQTRNPMHRAHFELTLRAAAQEGAHLLIHPAVGLTKPGDVDYFTRVKCYKHLLSYYPEGTVTLSLLPIAMRMAGPREALWHAIIRKNYGCTHFIVGRDHAGPGKDSLGRDFYDPYAAQELVAAYADEIDITVLPFKEMVYVKEDGDYQPVDEVPPHKTIMNISGTQLRNMLRDGKEIPAWFSFPEVVQELIKVYPPKSEQGFTLFFTGLPASGKSTLANAVAVKLMELQNRAITIMDADIIRTHLSSELGYSKKHRSINVRRVGFVASEISKNHGVAIVAVIAPYAEDRAFNRHLINSTGNYIEIYVATPLDICESRDPKGMYALARAGKIKEFTGVSDPYEVPENSEIVIEPTYNIGESVDLIIGYLFEQGLIN